MTAKCTKELFTLICLARFTRMRQRRIQFTQESFKKWIKPWMRYECNICIFHKSMRHDSRTLWHFTQQMQQFTQYWFLPKLRKYFLFTFHQDDSQKSILLIPVKNVTIYVRIILQTKKKVHGNSFHEHEWGPMFVYIVLWIILNHFSYVKLGK